MKVWTIVALLLTVSGCSKNDPAQQKDLDSGIGYEEVDGVKLPKDRPISFQEALDLPSIYNSGKKKAVDQRVEITPEKASELIDQALRIPILIKGTVKEIKRDSVVIQTDHLEQEVPNDLVTKKNLRIGDEVEVEHSVADIRRIKTK